MAAELDFHCFVGSTYGYLSVVRAEACAQAASVRLVWRTFSVRTLMREQNNTPFVGKQDPGQPEKACDPARST